MRIVNRKITSKEKIVVYAPEYLNQLSTLIKDYNATREGKMWVLNKCRCKRFNPVLCSILNNYMVWQTVKSYAAYLSKAFRDAYKGLRVALMGSEDGEEPQWKYCIQDTNNVLGEEKYTCNYEPSYYIKSFVMSNFKYCVYDGRTPLSLVECKWNIDLCI